MFPLPSAECDKAQTKRLCLVCWSKGDRTSTFTNVQIPVPFQQREYKGSLIFPLLSSWTCGRVVTSRIRTIACTAQAVAVFLCPWTSWALG